MDQENRVVVLIDMDCFYCQVEEKLDPELKGKPIAVVQYNPWKGGGIIAVNYVARARGVTRHMRGDEAREKCPEIQLPSVPCQRGKADISKYRDAGIEVARVLQRFTPLLERASIDEAYLDITSPVQERLKILNANCITSEMMPNTFALGYGSIEEFIQDVHNCSSDSIEFDYEHARRLLVGSVVVSEIRAAVYQETGYRCSAGIAHNKILAKLVCGMNKPDKQTLLPKHSVNILYRTLPIKKVKHLGGKFGDTVCQMLGVSSMGELQTFTEKQLQATFDEKNGTWLYNIARGIDLEPVQARFNPKSIGCCKQLRGKSMLRDLDSLRKWLQDLGDEIEDRLEKDSVENNRTPKHMVVSFTTQLGGARDASSSRSYNFAPDDELCAGFFAGKALELVMDSVEGFKVKDGEPNRKLKAPIKFLGISVGKFEDNSETKKTRRILDYFGAGPLDGNKSEDGKTSDSNKCKATDANCKSTDVKTKGNDGKDYIMQKFLQVSSKNEVTKSNTDSSNAAIEPKAENTENKTVVESTLDKQESFFAKFLNKGSDIGNKRTVNETLSKTESQQNSKNSATAVRPVTPACNVVNCGEDSNDTEYTGSTIDMEINKSIALFDDDPEEVVRKSSLRDLLTSTVNKDENNSSDIEETKTTNVKEPDKNENKVDPIQYFECPECKKILPLKKFEEHSDYHLALRLREEERQRVRKEVKESREKKESNKKVSINEELKRRKPEEQKNESVASIASFLVKIDDNVPTETCTECGKKIAVEKLTEHMDFHEAQKLSRQLNGKQITSFSNHKRKRNNLSPVKKHKLPRTSRSIDSFFR